MTIPQKITNCFLPLAVLLGHLVVPPGGGDATAAPDRPSSEAAELRAGLKRAARRNRPLPVLPGEGVGPIRFGMSPADVKQAVGEPYRISGKACEYQLLGVAVLFDREDRVVALFAGAWCESSDILLEVFKGATPEGVKLRSTRRKVVETYGPPDSTRMIGEKGLEFELLSYDRLRAQLAFRKDRLVHITLRRPAAASG